MTIEAYFARVESILRDFTNIRTYTLTKKIYNFKQGCIGGTVRFENDRRLEFVEVKDTESTGKMKYRYQYMDEDLKLIFRYDNAPHHSGLVTFPNHKHTMSEVLESREPGLYDILLEIALLERKEK